MSLTNSTETKNNAIVRRGYYFLHKKCLDDKTLASLTVIDKQLYLKQAKKADTKEKWHTFWGWAFGFVFYGGIGLWLLSSFASGSTSSPTTDSSTGDSSSLVESAEPDYESSVYEEPIEDEEDDCDPDYSGCVPDVSYDLDCDDIQEEVEVYGSDYHGFDGDGDGYGCESYY